MVSLIGDDPYAAMRAIQVALQAADVRAALDPRDVNPPAVLIRPPVLHYRFGRGCMGADWTLRLYLPNAGVVDALRVGFPILASIHEALATIGIAVVSATPAEFTTADSATVPGFTLTFSTQ